MITGFGTQFASGPPTERHSIAAVIVGRGANDELSPAEVSGFARVQQAVGKSSVIATAPLATEGSTSTSAGTAETVALAAAALAAPRNVEAGPITAAPPHQRGPATPAAPTNEGVRYITLQFHSVSYRT